MNVKLELQSMRESEEKWRREVEDLKLQLQNREEEENGRFRGQMDVLEQTILCNTDELEEARRKVPFNSGLNRKESEKSLKLEKLEVRDRSMTVLEGVFRESWEAEEIRRAKNYLKGNRRSQCCQSSRIRATTERKSHLRIGCWHKCLIFLELEEKLVAMSTDHESDRRAERESSRGPLSAAVTEIGSGKGEQKACGDT